MVITDILGWWDFSFFILFEYNQWKTQENISQNFFYVLTVWNTIVHSVPSVPIFSEKLTNDDSGIT